MTDDLKEGEDIKYFEPDMSKEEKKDINQEKFENDENDENNENNENENEEEEDEEDISIFSKPKKNEDNNYVSNLNQDYEKIKYNVLDILDYDDENNEITLLVKNIKDVMYFLKLRELILLNVLENYGKWKGNEEIIISPIELNDSIMFDIIYCKKLGLYKVKIKLINTLEELNDDDESDYDSEEDDSDSDSDILDKEIEDIITEIEEGDVDTELEIKDKLLNKKNKLTLVGLLFIENKIIPLFQNN